MCIRLSIKRTLNMLTRTISRLPYDKQYSMVSRVKKVVQKYKTIERQQQNKDFLKQLEFNVNFIKLSFPNVKLAESLSVEEEQNVMKQQAEKKQQKENEGEEIEIENAEQFKKWEEKAKEAAKGVREEMEVVNWSVGGTLDPQIVKKHKELLERQFFGGDYWKDNPIPINQSEQILRSFMDAGIGRDDTIHFGGPPDSQQQKDQPEAQIWQKVQR